LMFRFHRFSLHTDSSISYEASMRGPGEFKIAKPLP
jgi:hypothetical protein